MPSTEQHVYIIDRGQPVTLTIVFENPPEDVFVSYMPPGERKPVFDDGIGQPDSRIERLDLVTFRYVIPTVNMRAGGVWWHAWGTVDGEVSESIYGQFSIRETPPQLL